MFPEVKKKKKKIDVLVIVMLVSSDFCHFPVHRRFSSMSKPHDVLCSLACRHTAMHFYHWMQDRWKGLLAYNGHAKNLSIILS